MCLFFDGDYEEVMRKLAGSLKLLARSGHAKDGEILSRHSGNVHRPHWRSVQKGAQAV